MGKVIGRLIGIVIVTWIGAMVAALVGAVLARRNAPPLPDPSADEVDLQAIFEALDFRSTAQQFRGGNLVCWFGGGTLDLRDATLDPAGATLQIRAIFGGGMILVPETWNVITRVRGMGGAGDSRPSAERPGDAPTLTVEGMAFAGGFGIASALPTAREAGDQAESGPAALPEEILAD